MQARFVLSCSTELAPTSTEVTPCCSSTQRSDISAMGRPLRSASAFCSSRYWRISGVRRSGVRNTAFAIRESSGYLEALFLGLGEGVDVAFGEQSLSQW